LIAYQISKAYENIYKATFNKIAARRSLFVNINDSDRHQAAASAQKEISKHEAITFSIVYSNLLFFVFFIFCGFFLFANFSSAVNYVFTGVAAAGLVMLSSSSK